MSDEQTPPDGLAVFESWLSERANDSRDPLSPEAAIPYRYIWQSWCRWLEEHMLSASAAAPSPRYLQASSADVQRFLAHGPSPSSGRVAKTAPISEVTRRRYWRILDGVYRHARNLGLIEHNPADELLDGVRPDAEKSEGMVLTRLHFDAIYKVLPGAGGSPWDIRDRAILLLLLEAAPTPGEISGLLVSQVQQDMDAPGRLKLSITGSRRWQSRDITLSQLASEALQAWLEVRRKQGSTLQTVFITQRQEPMAKRPLFHLVAKAVAQSANEAGLSVPGHTGPQVVRNTRIVLWLNDGVPSDEVVRLVGFKDARSFRGLRAHIRAHVTVPDTSRRRGS